jgi:hypothetical protein
MLIKPVLTYEILINPQQYKDYNKKIYKALGIYLTLVILIQFLINIAAVNSKCGGNLTDNLAPAGLMTLFPWLLIFGAIIIVLIMYPGFKMAFSDVIGYFYVAGTANKVMTELLINKNIQQNIDASQMNETEKANMENAADAIIKICGNTSILINQIVPSNFDKYWEILHPLMKTKYQTDGPETTTMRKQLFNLVVMRDSIGEMLWYIYTGILLTSIVQMKISTTPCYVSKATMEKNYKNYLAEEQQEIDKKNSSKSTSYTVTS